MSLHSYKVMESCWREKETRLRPDIYEINTKISELLEEDSNVSSTVL